MKGARTETKVTPIKIKIRLKGKKLRDEFLCPITLELYRDPVVASDGHTYERSALERWFKTNSKSPRTGQVMVDQQMTLNINLKKLIQDIISEGGANLYTDDNDSPSRVFDIAPQAVLIMKCLGPAESEWNGHIQEVSIVYYNLLILLC